MDAEFLVAYTTFENGDQAQKFARELVGDGLVACANVLPTGMSIYRWQGSIESSPEALVIMKLRVDQWPALEARVRERHPYDVPELIATPVSQGSASYLAWLRDEGESP